MKKCWAIGTGNINPLIKRSRDAVKFTASLEGFVGISPMSPYGTVFLFESENTAKRAKNMMKAKGIITGKDIVECEIEDKYWEEAMRKRKENN